MMAEISPRKRIWGWYFFDWASQPYHTVLNTFIFGPFFASIAAAYFLGLVDTTEVLSKASNTGLMTLILLLLVSVGLEKLSWLTRMSGLRAHQFVMIRGRCVRCIRGHERLKVLH